MTPVKGNPLWMPRKRPLSSCAPDPVNNRWAIVTGQHSGPVPVSPVPPPRLAPPWYTRVSVADGEVYGPVSHAQAVNEVSRLLCDYKMLAVIPGHGVQCIYIAGLVSERLGDVFSDMGRRIPGMVFFPGDRGILMVGYGPWFAPIHTDDVVASCDPGMAFPTGAVYQGPDFDSRKGLLFAKPGDWKRPEDWAPSPFDLDMKTLEDLEPLAVELAAWAREEGV